MGYYSLYICTIAMLGLSVMTGAQAAQPVSGELASKPSNKLSSPLTAAQTIKGPGTIVVPRQSCGTHWTGYVDDPNVNVNPCPTNCERGERQTVNTRKEGGKLKYQARYQCFLPELTISKQIPGVSPQTVGNKPRQSCGTAWTGWLSDLNTTVNPCPRGCEPGELQLVNRSRSGSTVQYDKRYLCYKIEQTPAAPSTAQSGTKLTLPQAEPEPTVGMIEIARKSFKPRVITTNPIQLTGTRRPPFVPKSLTTAAIQLTGTRRPPFVPKVITTEPIQLTGTRKRLPAFNTDQAIKLLPTTKKPSTPR